MRSAGLSPPGLREGPIFIEETNSIGAGYVKQKGRHRVIYQELSLVREMSVGENIFLGVSRISLGWFWKKLYRTRAGELLADFHLGIQFQHVPVRSLGIAENWSKL